MNLDTGHPVIDEQHHHLERLVKNLDDVCELKLNTGEPCLNCRQHIPLCRDRLASLIGDLLSFMLDHFMYEEKLMRLLPDTDECRRHVDGHTRSHADISQQLSQLTSTLDNTDPRQSSLRLQKIIQNWLGQHARGYDCTLSVSLSDSNDVDLDYDKELSQLLGT